MTGEARTFLTADELAERWGVPRSQVYRLTREGKIPVVALGKYYRYKLSAIEAWEDRPDSSPIQEAA